MSKMANQRIDFKDERELQEAVLQEKIKGTSDVEIGRKYGVTFKYIEKLITKTQGISISTLKVSKRIKTFYPEDFEEEKTTVWSFKKRGNWATHSGEYRGNWSPYIPRNIILKYSKPGELVLDYFCGAGTTAIECKLLGRRCIALDINDKAIELAKKNIDFNIEPKSIFKKEDLLIFEPELLVGDARDLSFLKTNSVDLICAHPPYSNIIHYTDFHQGDLSFLDIEDFLREMSKVAKESFRVLKPGRQCAILIGDLRRSQHVIPLGFKLIDVYLDAGFKLKELVIKRQHNCKTTGFWYENSIKYNFLLLAHEYLPIFEKPAGAGSLMIKESGTYHNLIVPIIEKPSLKRRLDHFETTTVWVLPEKDAEKCLNKNVVDRYSDKGRYSIINFVPSGRKIKVNKEKKQEKIRLLFIKSPFLSNNTSCSNVEYYLKEIKEEVGRELFNISNGGFLVIQTQDVRIDGYIEPMAKRLVDILRFDKLWLKEIIVITQEKTDSNSSESTEYFKIAHQYLLVYEVKK